MAVTVAPGSTDFDSSDTIPVRVAVLTYAPATADAETISATTKPIERDHICPPFRSIH
jgi:hypothetical protein